MSEKRFDGRKILSEISGVPEAEVGSIFEQVKANQARIDSCPGPHRFEESPPFTIRDSLVCVRCGGRIRYQKVLWYVEGFVAAGGDRDVVLPNR